MNTESDHLQIIVVDAGDSAALALFAALDAELNQRYPGAPVHGVLPEEVVGERGVLLVGHLDGVPVTCGALRLLDEMTAEIKRVYVCPECRGQGLSRLLLAELERIARERGLTRLVLETGSRQPEAIGLYQSSGYTPIPLFGPYVNMPLSVCMAKTLA